MPHWKKIAVSTSEPDVFIVDVCGTLVSHDTTIGLLRYHFARSQTRSWRRYALGFFTARMSPARWAFVLLEKATGRHWLKFVLVRLLAKDTALDLDKSGEAYAQELLGHHRVKPVWERLRLITHPDQIILASASLEPVIKALADKIGARYVASVLEVRNGVLTGRYLEDLSGRKQQALERKFGPYVLQQPFIAISDNLSDRALLAMASQACVVLHRESHRGRWRNLPAVYIRLTG
jgi:phosphoserine phosphatase